MSIYITVEHTPIKYYMWSKSYKNIKSRVLYCILSLK